MKLDTALIVMGMHRSGTSALTRVLSLHGFGLPETLIPPGQANERGFWESPAINALNNQILEAIGQNWYSFDPVDPTWKDTATARKLLGSLPSVLDAEFGDARTIVIKDPRICRLADFWVEALAQRGARTAAVFIIRNPVEVAESLNSRNDFDPQLGKLLWLRHYLDAEAKTRGISRCFVNYEDLLTDWRAVLGRIREQLPLDFDDKLNPEVDAFLATDLRHHTTSHASTIAQIADFPWLTHAYQILHAWGQGQVPRDADLAILDKIRLALDEANPAFSSIVANARLDQKRLVTLRHSLEDRENDYRLDLKSALDRVVDISVETANSQAAMETRLLQAIERAEEREQVIELAHRNLDVAHAELRHTTTELAAARTAIDELERQTADASRRLAEMRMLDRKYKSSRVKLLHAQSDARHQAAELSHALAQIHAMEQTMAWRIHRAMLHVPKFPRLFGGFRNARRRQARLRSSADVVRTSTLFDATWYLGRYPDVEQAKIDPATHYVGHGWREGRDPGPHFSTSGYLRDNPDVAAADINPLLHFLEHGQSEGRSAALDAPAAVRKSREDFGPAHPCPQFDVAIARPVRWTCAGSLDRGVNTLQVGNVAAGYHADDDECRDAVEAIVRLFRFLSGEADEELVSPDREAFTLTAGAPPGLIDAWFTTDFTIRVRWRCDGDEAAVLRAIQWRCDEDRSAVLVGEGLIHGPLDSIDVTLTAPFAPLLFVACDTAGEMRGVSILPFPSVCRGGAHYGELLALAGEQERDRLDPIQLTRPLAADLAALKAGRAPLVSAIKVDLRGADGTEPIFRPELQAWLRNIMSIPLLAGEADSDRDAGAVAYLRGALQTDATPSRPEGAFHLEIRSDELPSIQIMAALKDAAACASTSDRQAIAMPFVLTESNPSMPKFLVTLPPGAGALVRMVSSSFRNTAPTLVPTNADVVCESADRIAAIRLLGDRPVQDAELLMPAGMQASHLLRPAAAGRIVAIVGMVGWDEPTLVAAIEALGGQAGADRVSILLLDAGAEKPASLVDVCDRLFHGRWSSRAAFPEQWKDYRDASILWIGQGVILHDPRTIETLAAIVERDDIVSAGCAMVHSANVKKGWATTLHSAGMVRWTAPLEDEKPLNLEDPRILQQAIYPVLQCMEDVWMARAARLGDTRDGQKVAFANSQGYHVCTSAITAGLAGERPALPAAVPTDLTTATHVKVLLG